MSGVSELFTLAVLFDRSIVDKDALNKAIEALLHDRVSEINIEVEDEGINLVKLTIKGVISTMDKCSDTLNTGLVNMLGTTGIRLVDETGDEIRRRAYPIIAKIEQMLRMFITRASVEVFGLAEWWGKIAPDRIRKSVQQTGEIGSRFVGLDNPLEFTQFDDLVEIVTAEVSEWDSNKTLSVDDISQLLLNSNSLEDLRENLASKTRKISLWDSVFGRYFDDKQQWEQSKKRLRFVIEERHKVMHHRPMRLGVIQALSKHEHDLQELFATAKNELTEQDRSEIQQHIEKLQSATASAIPAHLSAMEAFAPTIATFRQAKDVYDSVAEPIRRLESSMAPFATAYRNAQLKYERILEPAMRVQERIEQLGLWLRPEAWIEALWDQAQSASMLQSEGPLPEADEPELLSEPESSSEDDQSS